MPFWDAPKLINMNPAPTITQHEREFLESVSHGHYANVTVVPAAISALVMRGLVEVIPVISFPVMPTRYSFRITRIGQELLSDSKKR